ncbi:hypothetical protein [Sphingomonas mollis]|uniref:Uncharacterized protein n=1 Tax=Sphingomonas mollis TaxID=2795726 RepID=A0ABS0XND4_9SPHN|nr:hypothetical protein [Sphingomonas sp. BT553]MBJ6121557.1 hypothetical protein [Sphingomonas sp. BT553]
MNTIDDRALDSLSVAPDDSSGGRDPRQDAGQDKSIAKRLQKNPDSVDARLDNGLDETMDGSDPVSISEPNGGGEPAPSSGYDEAAEQERQRDA